MNRQIMSQEQQRKAAKDFSERWSQHGYEKGEKDKFWIDLLGNVFGVELPTEYIDFEKQVIIDDNQKYIDGYIPETKVLIEQKSSNIPLTKRTFNGTAFEQAVRYSNYLNYDERPRWIVTCNFERFEIYDRNDLNSYKQIIHLKDLENEIHRLEFLVDTENDLIKKARRISVEAGEWISEIYDALLKEYKNPKDPETLKSLNILCVRLVFCYYAEDANIFPQPNQFYRYMSQFKNNPTEFRDYLQKLFITLDKEKNERDKYIDPQLNAFPYVNGGLFANENIEIPYLNEHIVDLILKASIEVNWKEISPTIFGALFETTINPEERRKGGMHYTSLENIHKVIDPLFLDGLKKELKEAKEKPVSGGSRTKALQKLHNKLADLTFFDPACGSGNFLTETFISLRRLENIVIKELQNYKNYFKNTIEDPIAPVEYRYWQTKIINDNPESSIKVNINQFYGIEINDFAVAVANTALLIAESQMLNETEKIIQDDLHFLPLQNQANIHEANALRLNWNEVFESSEYSYIIGNPPYVGARKMDQTQKKDLEIVFGSKFKNIGNLDYISGWFWKALEFLGSTKTKVGFVSTNSLVQGESVGNLWKPLFQKGLRINFAYPTFKWNSESKEMAQVYCVIIGFSNKKGESKVKRLFFNNGEINRVNNINGYLAEGKNVFIESRKKPISKEIPEIGIGNQPIDNGNYLFKEDEMKEFIRKEPNSKRYFRPWYGSNEFLNKKPRFCLWLGNANPNELRKMPTVLKRIDNVREFRLKSKRKTTNKLADNPTHFQTENMPNGSYLLIPEVTTSKRSYIPIGFMDKNDLSSNLVKVLPNPKLYHFSILTSNVHMSWVRRVAGRYGNGYRYSKDIVYNNFPWPKLTNKVKNRLNKTAKAILDARDLYLNTTYADMYDDKMYLYPELLKAHEENDKAVMEAYGFDLSFTEDQIVNELFKLYDQRVKDLENK